MNRTDKLKSLKEKKAVQDMVIISNGEPFIEALSSKIVELKKTLGIGVELNNVDDLLEQLNLLQSFQNEIKNLQDVVKAFEFPDKVQINGLEELVGAIKAIKQEKAPTQTIAVKSTSGVVRNAGNNPILSKTARIVGFSLTTNSTEALICTFRSGNDELWRVLLQSPPEISTGANLAVSAPAYLFYSDNLVLNLSSSQAVHYSVSYLDGV